MGGTVAVQARAVFLPLSPEWALDVAGVGAGRRRLHAQVHGRQRHERRRVLHTPDVRHPARSTAASATSAAVSSIPQHHRRYHDLPRLHRPDRAPPSQIEHRPSVHAPATLLHRPDRPPPGRPRRYHASPPAGRPRPDRPSPCHAHLKESASEARRRGTS
jgi:hypothetical protein